MLSYLFVMALVIVMVVMVEHSFKCHLAKAESKWHVQGVDQQNQNLTNHMKS